MLEMEKYPDDIIAQFAPNGIFFAQFADNLTECGGLKEAGNAAAAGEAGVFPAKRKFSRKSQSKSRKTKNIFPEGFKRLQGRISSKSDPDV